MSNLFQIRNILARRTICPFCEPQECLDSTASRIEEMPICECGRCLSYEKTCSLLELSIQMYVHVLLSRHPYTEIPPKLSSNLYDVYSGNWLDCVFPVLFHGCTNHSTENGKQFNVAHSAWYAKRYSPRSFANGWSRSLDCNRLGARLSSGASSVNWPARSEV